VRRAEVAIGSDVRGASTTNVSVTRLAELRSLERMVALESGAPPALAMPRTRARAADVADRLAVGTAETLAMHQAAFRLAVAMALMSQPVNAWSV
jgi:hypothetical protein